MTRLLLSAGAAWTLGALVHWWPRLSVASRRRASVATGAAGVAFLVAALRAEGLRESATTAAVLLGSTVHTSTVSASASLYYYVLTAVCLLLGFAGLAAGESLSRWLREHWLLSCVAVAWALTAVRFVLEKSAAPAFLIHLCGVTWMAPVAGAYMATAPGVHGLGPLSRALVPYAYLVRGFVAAVELVATRLSFGTHYDVSGLVSVSAAFTGETYAFVPGSPAQAFWLILVPQLTVWPLLTVLAGLAAGLVVRRLSAAPRLPGPSPAGAPSGPGS